MKKITLILGLLIMAMLPAGAVKRIDANPVNVAFTISQETDPDYIASTLRYYGYELQTSNDGYSTFRNQNGSVIKYTFKDGSENQPYPYVEVRSNQARTNTDNALEGLQFKKTDNHYVCNVGLHAKTETRCSHSHQGYLVFHRTVLPRK